MPQTKRQEKKMLTRQKIMDTAFRLFASDGFSTTTHTIAREAGLSHGALFVHFPTREALQLSVLERFTRELGGKLHDLSLQEGSLAELLHAHINILSAYESFYRHMICELSALPQSRPFPASYNPSGSCHIAHPQSLIKPPFHFLPYLRA